MVYGHGFFARHLQTIAARHQASQFSASPLDILMNHLPQVRGVLQGGFQGNNLALVSLGVGH